MQCLVALLHPVDAPEVVLKRGRVQVRHHLVEVDDLLDHVEVELVDEAEADPGEDAGQPQRADRRREVGVAAFDPPLHRPAAGVVDADQLDPVQQLVERVPRAGRRGAGGDQPCQRLVVGAAGRGHRLATAAQLRQEIVQRHVRRGLHRHVSLVEVHRLRQA
jgi:hypothetical protein